MINAIRVIWNMLVFQMKLKREFLNPLRCRIYFPGYTYWEYKILKLNEEKLNSYIDKKARELATSEGVSVFDVSYEEMNKKDNKEDWSVGLFIYYKNKKKQKDYELLVQDLKNTYESIFKKPFEESIYYSDYSGRKNINPRIELAIDRAGVFTLLHELGHYFIYKKEEDQSEDKADLYIDEFFDEHLPPFFKWCCQIMINVRTKNTKTKMIFSEEESFMYWKDYQLFFENN